VWRQFGCEQLRLDECASFDGGGGEQTMEESRERVTIPTDVTRATVALCRLRRTTLYVALLTSCFLALRRMTARPRLALLAYFGNRSCWPRAADTVGLFANTHLLGVDLSRCASLDDALEQVRRTVELGIRHQAAPTGAFSPLVGRMLTGREQKPAVSLTFDCISAVRRHTPEALICNYAAAPPLGDREGIDIRAVYVNHALALTATYDARRVHVGFIRRLLGEMRAAISVLAFDSTSLIDASPR
jgi:hypothetical protein